VREQRGHTRLAGEADAGTDGCPRSIQNGGFVVACLHP